MIGAESDADLEHALPLRALERGKLLDVRLKFIPPTRLLVIGLLSCIVQIELLATGGTLPEVPDGLFVSVNQRLHEQFKDQRTCDTRAQST